MSITIEAHGLHFASRGRHAGKAGHIKQRRANHTMTLLQEHLRTDLPRPRSICYVGEAPVGSTALCRTRALERLGQRVTLVDVSKFAPKITLLSKIRFRYPVGPLVSQLNKGILKQVYATHPEVVILDKPIYITPDTVHKIKKTGAKVVCYVQDGPFGPRNDGCWKLFYKIYKLADLHCLLRNADIPRYEQWGLPYIKLMLSYAPEVHAAPPDSWSDKDRDRGVSYIGYPYENRPHFLTQLVERFKLPVAISGPGWEGILPPALSNQLIREGYLIGPAYNQAIWKSKINLSFVTQLNEEDIAHKAVEIAASGGFLLALRTPGHQACFEEDREAVFFSSVEECAEKAAYYLAHEAERSEIAHRGYLRAVQSGYSNDTQLAHMLNDPRL